MPSSTKGKKRRPRRRRKVIYKTPGHECQHADRGACPLCRSAHHTTMKSPSLAFTGLEFFSKAQRPLRIRESYDLGGSVLVI